MIPLQDLTPRRSFPTVTLLLILVNTIVFLYQVSLPPHAADVFIMTYGVVPYKIQMALQGHHYTLQEAFLPLFTCMFLHGGWLHIIGNMWFLWIFGANVEDRMGPIAYLLFYLVCGIGSSIAQTLFSWGSHIPSLGASGAIAGVLGAYIVFFPRSQISSLVTLLIIWFRARSPRDGVHRLVVRDAVRQRHRFAGHYGRGGFRRSRVVGARRRISPRHADRSYNVI